MSGEDVNGGVSNSGIPQAVDTNSTPSGLQMPKVPASIRTRAQQAILRLIAGGIGLPYFTKVRDNLDAVEGRSKVNAMIAEEVGRQAILDPLIMERAKARLLGDLVSKQENVEAIALKAQRLLEYQGAEPQPAIDARQAVEEEGPSDDWMNSFSRVAEDASSDQLRDYLARLLAGEISQPGKFSKTTIRMVAEIEQDVLAAFIGARQSNGFGDVIFTEEDWNTGAKFTDGVLLENSGLIYGSSGFTHRTVPFDQNGNGFVIGNKYGLVIKATSTTDKKQISIWLLTKAGIDLSKLLDTVDERNALRRVADKIDKGGVRQIVMGPVFHQPMNRFNVIFETVLWNDGKPGSDNPSLA